MSSEEGGWTVVSYQKKKKEKPVVEKPFIPLKTTPINTTSNIIKKPVYNNAHKIDNETETFHTKRFGSLGKIVASHRNIARLTQQELANKIQVKLHIIKSVEDGTGIYDGKLLNKLKQELKFK
jgi:ribosome-binding protein aMBF1 (putative translation factor)